METMRLQKACAYAALLFILLPVPAASIPASHANSASARHFEPSGGFSYVPPPKWEMGALPGQKYKIWLGPPSGSISPNIVITDNIAAFSLDEYARLNIAHMQNEPAHFQFLNQGKPFVTRSGLHGVRFVVILHETRQEENIRTIYYIFPAPNDHKIIVVSGWRASDGEKYTQVIDACMKTFALK